MNEIDLNVTTQRLGTVLRPNGSPDEVEGILNPASARMRSGELLLYPRVVARGNISRVGRVQMSANGAGFQAVREGYALEPEAPFELREQPGYGCEDPRVTFVPVLDAYLMAYTAYGPEGPRVAVAISNDGWTWRRVGLMRFTEPGMSAGDDKDGAFFPEPVRSPKGTLSLAFYHRPMLHLSALDGRAAIPMIERMPYQDRESIRIGYLPLDAVLANTDALLDVRESVLVLPPDDRWGSLKIGAGTPPVRVAEGWMSLFHAVDVIDNSGHRPKLRYSAGIVVHDADEPHHILYRSPHPVLSPESDDERSGIVDNLVFPTGIDPRPDLNERTFDVFYCMADLKVGAARLHLGG